MATFPDLCYSRSGYGYKVSPLVVRTEYASSNTRQRLMRDSRDDAFTVSLRASGAELAEFETFVLDTLNNGADTFDGPYYTSDAESTGTLEISNGEYAVDYLAPDIFDISYIFEVKDRSLEDEQAIYELVNGFGGFDGLIELFDQLAITVNENTLVA